MAVREQIQAMRQTKKKAGPRVEIWVSHDGTSTKDQVPDDKEEDLSLLSAIEVLAALLIVSRCLMCLYINQCNYIHNL